MADLVSLAEKWHLPACAAVLRAFPGKFPKPAAPDAGLGWSLPNDGERALGPMMRRGLDPRLWRVLRTHYADRPLERGLLAWDVLTGSLIDPQDRATLGELRHDARAVRAILPEAGQRALRPGHPQTAALVEALRPKSLRTASHAELIDAAADLVIGSYDLLRRVEGHDRKLLEVWRNWARLLHRAHLPTLSAFYLDELWTAQGHRPALPDLVEVLLDSGFPGVMEWGNALVETDPTSRPALSELALYSKIRSAVNSGTSQTMVEWLERDRVITEGLARSPEQAGGLSPLPTVAYTEVGLLHGKRTLALPVIIAAVKHVDAWRYGMRVMTVLGARDSNQKSPDFMLLFEKFLTNFGNEHQLWHDSASYAGDQCAWLAGLVSTLVRELTELPHDPEVWQAAAWVFDPSDLADAAVAEVRDRLRHQSVLDVS